MGRLVMGRLFDPHPLFRLVASLSLSFSLPSQSPTSPLSFPFVSAPILLLSLCCSLHPLHLVTYSFSLSHLLLPSPYPLSLPLCSFSLSLPPPFALTLLLLSLIPVSLPPPSLCRSVALSSLLSILSVSPPPLFFPVIL